MNTRKAKRSFRMIEIGSVKKTTKGLILLPWTDGGEYPFDRGLWF